MSSRIREIGAGEFVKKVIGGRKVAVGFYAPESVPSRLFEDRYEALSEIYGEDISFLKIHRPRYQGLARCLGVASPPALLFYENGKRIGERLTGGIRWSDIVRHLERLLKPERARELRSRLQPVTTTCDALILGGGPAGLTAGIYLTQAQLNTLLVDVSLPGGYVKTTYMVSNYPGFADAPDGLSLSRRMLEHAKKAGVGFRSAVEVSSVDLEKKEVLLDGFETVKARSILIATGSSPRRLGVPGEKELRGRGISYCSTCDAKYYKDKEVIVIGGGNSAVEESVYIAKFASRVTIVHRLAELQANKEAQARAHACERVFFLYRHEPRSFTRRPNEEMAMEVGVESLVDHTRLSLRANGVFIFAGFTPNVTSFGDALKRDSYGYIITDERMATGIPGVYAAGDVRSKPFRQITTATADGTIAGIAMSRELG